MTTLARPGIALAAVGLLIATIPSHAPPPPSHGLVQQQGAPSSSDRRVDPRLRYARLPIVFEPNRGQADPQVRFLSRGSGYSLFLTPDAAVLRLQASRKPDAIGAGHTKPVRRESSDAVPTLVRMTLTGATAQAPIEALDRQPGTSNYFHGNDPAQWQHHVAHYGRVRYRAVYPGIDLVYHGSQQQLEYDFVLAPGADPARIGLRFEGPESLQLDPRGNLVLRTPQGDLLQQRPIAYQDDHGQRRPVDAAYRLLEDRRVRFEVGDYDHTQPLVIDPMLSYSTYLGGSGDESNYYPVKLAVDALGNTYVTGSTSSLDFPSTAAIQDLHRGPTDAFISRLSADGTTLVYSTYLGGSSYDAGSGIAVDAGGNAYVTGTTNSGDFPLSMPMRAAPANGFVTKLTSTGTLAYSTYLGDFTTQGEGIAVNGAGEAYVVGIVGGGESAGGVLEFPAGSFQPTQRGGRADGFLVKFNAAGSAWVYGGYLGGNDWDDAIDVAVDPSGNAYVTGSTSSTDFPVGNAVQAHYVPDPDYIGPNPPGDAFVTKVDAAGTDIVYSTYLGGRSDDLGLDVAVDSTGAAYVVGTTYDDFPTKGVLLPAGSGGFVAKLSASGNPLVYSVYLPYAYGVAVNSSGNAFVTGATPSPGFPTASPWQPDLAGDRDGYVAELNPMASDFVWSSFLGGSGRDDSQSIALGPGDVVQVAGLTTGAFPIVAGVQPAYGGGATDAFIARISGPPVTSSRYRHGDFNDDGRADILWRQPTTGKDTLWSAANAGVPWVVATRTGTDWVIVATGDFNGDHRADIVWRNRATGADEIWQSGRKGNTRFLTGVTNLDWTIVGAGDFDGDGRSDLLWRNTTGTGNNVIWLSGNSATSQTVSAVTNLEWRLAGVGDFNGDGKADILWRNTARTGNDVIWRSAKSNTPQAVSAVTNLQWHVVGTGDFDGDGIDDILWRNTTDTGNNVIWRSGNSSLATVSTVGDLAWQVASVADFDGDGRSDILWRDNDAGADVIWRSGNVNTQQAVTGVTNVDWQVIP